MRPLQPILDQLKKYYDDADGPELFGDREDFIISAMESLQNAVSCEGEFDSSEYQAAAKHREHDDA